MYKSVTVVTFCHTSISLSTHKAACFTTCLQRIQYSIKVEQFNITLLVHGQQKIDMNDCVRFA